MTTKKCRECWMGEIENTDAVKLYRVKGIDGRGYGGLETKVNKRILLCEEHAEMLAVDGLDVTRIS